MIKYNRAVQAAEASVEGKTVMALWKQWKTKIVRGCNRLRGNVLRRACRTLAAEGHRLDADDASWDARFALWLLEHMAKKPKDSVLPTEMEYIAALHDTDSTRLTEDHLITDQRAFPEIRFGKAGNTADHGCGWVAAYNVRRMLGEDVEPETVLRAVWRGARFGGRMGTDPFYLLGYFRALGYEATLVSGTERMEAAAKQARAFILLYVFDGKEVPGGHFIAGRYSEEADAFRILNGEHGGDVLEESLTAAQNGKTLLRFLLAIDGEAR